MLVKQAPESGAVEIAAEGTASLADLVQTASQFGIEREVDQIASKAGLTPRASREGLPSAPSGPRVITKHLVRRGGITQKLSARLTCSRDLTKVLLELIQGRAGTAMAK